MSAELTLSILTYILISPITMGENICTAPNAKDCNDFWCCMLSSWLWNTRYKIEDHDGFGWFTAVDGRRP